LLKVLLHHAQGFIDMQPDHSSDPIPATSTNLSLEIDEETFAPADCSAVQAESDASSDLLSIYEKYPCAAEILLPYRFYNGPLLHVLLGWWQSPFKTSVWNMDSPWIMAVLAALLGNVLLSAYFWVLEHILHSIDYYRFAYLALYLLLAMPCLYVGIVAVNFALAYGKDWWRYFLGPTHIGLTDSGFKLYYRGRLFYNYPRLSLWSDVTSIGVVTEARDRGGPALLIAFQNGSIKKMLRLPLSGFSSEQERLYMLRQCNRFISGERQSSSFQEASQSEFKVLLEKLKQVHSAKTLPLTNE
jgi:hypothetical protein